MPQSFNRDTGQKGVPFKAVISQKLFVVYDSLFGR
jgi:hypothetical protein